MKKKDYKNLAKAITMSLVLGTAVTVAQPVWAVADVNSLGTANFRLTVNAGNEYDVATKLGQGSVMWGKNTVASGDRASAWGNGSVASGNNATAFGYYAVASGARSVAWGANSVANGEASTAFGENSVASGRNSLAALGGNSSGNNSVAIGQYAKATGNNDIAIGQYAQTSPGDATDKTIKTTNFAVGGGISGNNVYYAKITGVADGVADHDAATVGQVKKAATEAGANISITPGTTGMEVSLKEKVVQGDATVEEAGKHNAVYDKEGLKVSEWKTGADAKNEATLDATGLNVNNKVKVGVDGTGTGLAGVLINDASNAPVVAFGTGFTATQGLVGAAGNGLQVKAGENGFATIGAYTINGTDVPMVALKSADGSTVLDPTGVNIGGDKVKIGVKDDLIGFVMPVDSSETKFNVALGNYATVNGNVLGFGVDSDAGTANVELIDVPGAQALIFGATDYFDPSGMDGDVKLVRSTDKSGLVVKGVDSSAVASVGSMKDTNDKDITGLQVKDTVAGGVFVGAYTGAEGRGVGVVVNDATGKFAAMDTYHFQLMQDANNSAELKLDGLTVKDSTKTVTFGVNGISAGNQQITNVADGSVTTGSKDAVNGGQLFAVDTKNTLKDGDGNFDITVGDSANNTTIKLKDKVTIGKRLTVGDNTAASVLDATGFKAAKGADFVKAGVAADGNNKGFSVNDKVVMGQSALNAADKEGFAVLNTAADTTNGYDILLAHDMSEGSKALSFNAKSTGAGMTMGEINNINFLYSNLDWTGTGTANIALLDKGTNGQALMLGEVKNANTNQTATARVALQANGTADGLYVKTANGEAAFGAYKYDETVGKVPMVSLKNGTDSTVMDATGLNVGGDKVKVGVYGTQAGVIINGDSDDDHLVALGKGVPVDTDVTGNGLAVKGLDGNAKAYVGSMKKTGEADNTGLQVVEGANGVFVGAYTNPLDVRAVGVVVNDASGMAAMDGYHFQLMKDSDSAELKLDGLTVTNGTKTVKFGLNEISAGGNKITGVDDGSVTTGSKDAVNGGQLKAVDTKRTLKDADDPNGNFIINPTDSGTTIKLKDKVNIKESLTVSNGINFATLGVDKTSSSPYLTMMNMSSFKSASLTELGLLVTDTVGSNVANLKATGLDVNGAVKVGTGLYDYTNITPDNTALTGISLVSDPEGANKFNAKLGYTTAGMSLKMQSVEEDKHQRDMSLTSYRLEFNKEGSTVNARYSWDGVAFYDTATSKDVALLNKDGLTVNDATKTVTFSVNGISAGGQKITNVAAGTADTDAVNYGQLKAVDTKRTLTDADGNDGNFVINATDSGTTIKLKDKVNIKDRLMVGNATAASVLDATGFKAAKDADFVKAGVTADGNTKGFGVNDKVVMGQSALVSGMEGFGVLNTKADPTQGFDILLANDTDAGTANTRTALSFNVTTTGAGLSMGEINGTNFLYSNLNWANDTATVALLDNATNGQALMLGEVKNANVGGEKAIARVALQANGTADGLYVKTANGEAAFGAYKYDETKGKVPMVSLKNGTASTVLDASGMNIGADKVKVGVAGDQAGLTITGTGEDDTLIALGTGFTTADDGVGAGNGLQVKGLDDGMVVAVGSMQKDDVTSTGLTVTNGTSSVMVGNVDKDGWGIGMLMTNGSNTIVINPNGIDMGTQKITNLANGTADGDAVNYGQLKPAVNSISYNPATHTLSYTTIGDGSGQVVAEFEELKSPVRSASDTEVSVHDKVFTYDTTDKALSWGEGNVAKGVNSTAFGQNSIAGSLAATAFGKNSMAGGENSLAALGAVTGNWSTGATPEYQSGGKNSVAIGWGAKAPNDNSVAIGQYAVASSASAVDAGKKTVTNEFAVGGGKDDSGYTYYARITGVADGVNAHDAATVGQIITQVGDNLTLGATDNSTKGQKLTLSATPTFEKVKVSKNSKNSTLDNTGLNVNDGRVKVGVDSAKDLAGILINNTSDGSPAVALGTGFLKSKGSAGDGNGLQVKSLSSDAIVAVGSMGTSSAADTGLMVTDSTGKNMVMVGNTSQWGIGMLVTNGNGKTITINPNGIDMGGSKITNVGAGTAVGDAVNYGQMSTALASKQDSLTTAQLAAADSGVTAEKVIAYDGYATSKQDVLTTDSEISIKSLTTTGAVTAGSVKVGNVVIDGTTNRITGLAAAQQKALNSGITAEKVSTYDGYATTIAGKQDALTAGDNITFSGSKIGVNPVLTNLTSATFVNDEPLKKLEIDSTALTITNKNSVDYTVKLDDSGLTIDNGAISLTRTGGLVIGNNKLTSDGLTVKKVTVGNVTIDSATNRITGLAAAQQKALNSGIDSAKVGQIETNKTDIATNKADIATNKVDIATNKTDIATNKADIATNKTDIATNANNIDDLKQYNTDHAWIKDASGHVVEGKVFIYSTGKQAISWGDKTQATGVNATAFGYGTKASGKDATAFGYNTVASNNNATAFGKDTVASGERATAWGNQTQAAGKNATAFGYLTVANGSNSVAFGNGSKAGGDNSLAALGGKTGTWDDDSVILGHNALAIGVNANAQKNETYAIGKNAIVSAENGIALGNDANVSGAGSVALGAGSVANEANTVSVGSATQQRKVVNVADGVADSDAVNVGQMNTELAKKQGTLTSANAGANITITNGVIALDDKVKLTSAGSVHIGNVDRYANLDYTGMDVAKKEGIYTYNGSYGATVVSMWNVDGNGKKSNYAQIGYMSGFGGTASDYMVKVSDATNTYGTAIDINGVQVKDNAATPNTAKLTATGLVINDSVKLTTNGLTIGANDTWDATNGLNATKATITGAVTAGSVIVGDNKLTDKGLAVGDNTLSTYGLKVGDNTLTTSGLKIGDNTLTGTGLKIGNNTLTASGLKIGNNTLTGNGLTIGTVKINSNGIDAGGKKISNVFAGTENTDAVNVGQMNTAISGMGDKKQDKFNAGKNLEFTGEGTDDYALNLEDNISLTSAEFSSQIKVGSNTFTDTALTIGNSRLTNNGLTVGTNTLTDKALTIGNSRLTNVGLTVGDNRLTEKGVFVGQNSFTEKALRIGDSELTANGLTTKKVTVNGAVTAETFKVGDKTYISADGINANGQKITGVKDGKLESGSRDAVNAGQLYATNQRVGDLEAYNNVHAWIKDSNGQVVEGQVFTYDTAKKALSWGVLDGENSNIASGNHATAFGKNTLASGNNSVAFGVDTEATANQALAFGNGTRAIGNNATAFGQNTVANGSNSTAFGRNSMAGGNNSLAALGGITGIWSGGATPAHQSGGANAVAIGVGAHAQKDATYAIGTNAVVSADNGIALGNNANVSGKNSVALGSNSVASADNVISVGKAGAERKIVNVADGNVASGSKDAVNGGQLYDATTLKDKGNNYAANTKVLDAVKALDGVIGDYNTVKGNYVGKATTNTIASDMLALDAAISGHDVAISGLDKRVASNAEAIKGLNETVIPGLDARIASNAEAIKGLNTVASGLDQRIASNKESIDKIHNRIGIEDVTIEGTNSIALGNKNTVKGDKSTVVGYANEVYGDGSGAFGDPNLVYGDGSYAFGNNNFIGTEGATPGKVNNSFAIGNKNIINAANSFAIGNEAKVTAENSIALGNGSVANEANTVSVGAAGAERRITNVADGVNATDVATVGQVATVESGLRYDLDGLNSHVNKLDNRINKVGAGAAALAALHPLDFDPDNKLAFSAGVGNYKGETAAALGVFYRPMDRVMFSMGGTIGNDNNMVNAGITFALDRKVKSSDGMSASSYKKASREALVDEVYLLNAENTKMNDKMDILNDENTKLSDRMQAMERKLAQQAAISKKQLAEKDAKFEKAMAEQNAKIAALMEMLEKAMKK